MKCDNCGAEYEQEYCPICDIRYLKEIPRWYYQNWFITVCLIFLLPVGLFLVWKKPGWTINIKITVTAAVVVVISALTVSYYQSSIEITELYIRLEEEKTTGYDTGLTIEADVDGTPGQADLLGIIYYSDDETVAVFKKGKLFTVGEGKTEIYVSDKGKTVFSNRITIEVIDKEAEWIAREESRAKQAAEIEKYINGLGEITFDSAEDISSARNAYNSAENQVRQMVSNLDILESAEQEYQLILDNNQHEITEDDYSLIVYYTQTGSKYHYLDSCGNGIYYPCTLKEAIDMDLESCGKCVNYQNYLKLRSE